MTEPLNTIEPDPRDSAPLAGDRGAPTVKATRANKIGGLLPMLVTVLALLSIAGLGWYFWTNHLASNRAADNNAAGNVATKTSIGKIRNGNEGESTSPRKIGVDAMPANDVSDRTPTGLAEGETAVPAIEAEHPRAAPIPVQGMAAGQQTSQEPPPRSRFDAPLVFVDTQSLFPAGSHDFGHDSPASANRPDYSVPPVATPAAAPAPLEKGSLNLTILKTPAASATLLGKRDFILAKGALIECDLDTAMDSTTPGMVRCTTTKDTWSDNGQVILVERGSTVTGEYKADMQTGQTRIQVIWNRIKTSKGIVIDLASPATDSLGRSGVDGDIDNRWGERIGSAFLLSTIKDAIAYQTAANARNGTGTIAYGNTTSTGESMANTVLKQTSNIPPTLTRNQGTQLNIFVARDLDFSRVYELRLKTAGDSDEN